MNHDHLRRRIFFILKYIEFIGMEFILNSQRIHLGSTLERNLSRSIKITCFNVIRNLTLVLGHVRLCHFVV